MVSRRVRAPQIDFAALRRELELPESFPDDVRLAATEAAGAPAWPSTDRTDIPFVTLDPPGSLDLDQAMHLSRRGSGYRVRYAIADVTAFVAPGGPIDTEAWRRAETIYFPDTRVPLHPRVLSEGAASLLPGVDRPAVLWTIDLDEAGEPTDTTVERALVRSRAQLDYPTTARGDLPEPIALLPEIGALRRARAIERGAIDLRLPEQEVARDGAGWQLVLRAPERLEDDNAQISLLTGGCAAALMLGAGVGVLRTLPPPAADEVVRVRAGARTLGIDWPDGASPGAVVASVDPATPRGAAFMDLATRLLRGAGYTAFDGTPPALSGHSAVGTAYAHVTAPLRRLADRYAAEACLAAFEGRTAPDWVRAGLAEVPAAMAAGDARAGAAERAVVELTEAVLLADRIGESFSAAVLELEHRGNGRPPRGTVALAEPPVWARCEGNLPLGERIAVRLVDADPVERRVLFRYDG